jgi:RNA polymerase sigma factor (sigma-70 family)
MIDEIRKMPLIRIPQEAQQKVKTLKEARSELTHQTGQATDEALAANLGWSIEEIHQVAALPVTMCEATTTDDRGEEDQTAGIILADQGPDPEKHTLRQELGALVHKCLEALPSSEDRLILLGRIVEGLKLRELADMLDCTAENIRLRQKKVENWMQSCLEKRGWSKDGWIEILK